MEVGKKSHILLRAADGTLYALEAEILQSTKISKTDLLESLDDDMKIIQSMAFTIDDAGNPQARGNSCAFAKYAAEAFKDLQPNDHFIYLNLDFNLNIYGNTDE